MANTSAERAAVSRIRASNAAANAAVRASYSSPAPSKSGGGGGSSSPAPAPSAQVSTYVDPTGQTHVAEDYSAQGGGKYDTVIAGAKGGYTGSGFQQKAIDTLSQSNVKSAIIAEAQASPAKADELQKAGIITTKSVGAMGDTQTTTQIPGTTGETPGILTQKDIAPREPEYLTMNKEDFAGIPKGAYNIRKEKTSTGSQILYDIPQSKYPEAQKRQDNITSFYSSWRERAEQQYEEQKWGVFDPVKRIPQGAGDFILGGAEMAVTFGNIGQTAIESRGGIFKDMAANAPRALKETPGQIVEQIKNPIFKYGLLEGGLYNIGQLGAMVVIAKATGGSESKASEIPTSEQLLGRAAGRFSGYKDVPTFDKPTIMSQYPKTPSGYSSGSPETFFKDVKSGKLSRPPMPGNQRGLYSTEPPISKSFTSEFKKNEAALPITTGESLSVVAKETYDSGKQAKTVAGGRPPKDTVIFPSGNKGQALILREVTEQRTAQIRELQEVLKITEQNTLKRSEAQDFRYVASMQKSPFKKNINTDAINFDYDYSKVYPEQTGKTFAPINISRADSMVGDELKIKDITAIRTNTRGSSAIKMDIFLKEIPQTAQRTHANTQQKTEIKEIVEQTPITRTEQKPFETTWPKRQTMRDPPERIIKLPKGEGIIRRKSKAAGKPSKDFFKTPRTNPINNAANMFNGDFDLSLKNKKKRRR